MGLCIHEGQQRPSHPSGLPPRSVPDRMETAAELRDSESPQEGDGGIDADLVAELRVGMCWLAAVGKRRAGCALGQRLSRKYPSLHRVPGCSRLESRRPPRATQTVAISRPGKPAHPRTWGPEAADIQTSTRYVEIRSSSL